MDGIGKLFGISVVGGFAAFGLVSVSFASHGQEAILRWRFDTGSMFAGTTAYDSTGNGNNGVLQGGMGTVNWVQGKYGTALVFDGIDDNAVCTDAQCGGSNKLDFAANENFSFGGWVKTTAPHIGTLVSKKTHGGPTEQGYLLRTLNSPDRIQCLISDGATHIANVAVQFPYADNAWHHIFCVYKGTSARAELYIDGKLAATGSVLNATGSLDNASDFRVGTQGNGANPFNGTIDDVRVYRRALPGPEIARFLQTLPFQGIPSSPVPQKSVGQWTFTKNDAFVPGTDWSPLDETRVFHTRFQHTQGPANTFELRVGKGGQIYSLIAPYGETIAPQALANSEWVDEVLQTATVDRNQNNPPTASYFIHQAGAYKRDPIMTETFYSPILSESWDAASKTYSAFIWPQQAHVPTNFTSKMLLDQKIRDLGDGILEVTYLWHNFGQDEMGFISLPWVVVRNSSLPVQYMSQPDGAYQRNQKDWPKGLIDVADIGGWFLFANGDTSQSEGFGMVIGESQHVGSGFQWDHHKWRWGTILNTARDGAVGTVQGRVTISPGENFFWRYYLIINTVEKIQQYGNELVEYVEYGPIQFPQGTSPKISLCTKTTITGQVTLTDSCVGKPILFQTYQNRIDGSQPILVLRDTNTNTIVLTPDPYKISAVPYDGKTSYDGFLGWALPSDPVMQYINATNPSLSAFDKLHLFLDKVEKRTLSGSNFDPAHQFQFRLTDNTGTVKLEMQVTPKASTLEIDFASQDLSGLSAGFYTVEVERTLDGFKLSFPKQFLFTKLGDLPDSQGARDGKIDIVDVSHLLSRWQSIDPADLQVADINPGPTNVSQGKIDIFDANRLMVNWTG